jgi:adenine-specific DNA methylase
MERWRDTTRKRRDDNNEIMFGKALGEMYKKYKGAFSLFAIENHVNQHCFLGGRYYNGQTIAKLEHRLKHIKNDGQEIHDVSVGKSLKKLEGVFAEGDAIVLNGDIMGILEADMIETDLLYLDPPYGGGSSDYAHLYRFLEEYLYECKLEDMEHIVQGSKRFVRGKQFREEFEHLLSLCGGFKTWLISYNESSFANIDTITSIIRNAGRSNISLHEVPITYQYRKGKNKVAMSKFNGHTGFDPDADRKYLERGIEYLILAR